jgi:MYXO-CTERM domain-containing protein
MSAADRTRRSPLACLLVALVLALGLGGAAHAGTAPGDGHSVIASLAGSQGQQAVIDLHSHPRLGEHRQPGKAAGPLSALVIALLLGHRRRSFRPRTAPPALGRPACGSRAPPGLSTTPA